MFTFAVHNIQNMKKIFILSLVAMSTLTVSAQRKKVRANTSKGNWALRIGAGFNTATEDPTDASSVKGSEFNISPSVGYFVADNLEIGAKFDYTNAKMTNIAAANFSNEMLTNDLGFGIYGQKYFPVNNWFAFTGRIDLGLTSGTEKETIISSGTPGVVNRGRNGFGGAANFGLAFTPANNIAIQADVIGLGASSLTRTSDVAGSTDINESAFGLNAWRQPMNVSLVWFLNRGGSED